jgi:hypothetical protein
MSKNKEITNMSMFLPLMAIVLVNGSIQAQQPAQKKSTSDEESLQKLDPFIVKAVKINPNDTPLRKLQKERCSEALIALVKHQDRLKNRGWKTSYFTPFLDLVESLSNDLQEVTDAPEDKIKCYEFAIAALKGFEEHMETLAKRERELNKHYNLAKAARIDAEIELVKFKAEMEKPKK